MIYYLILFSPVVYFDCWLQSNPRVKLYLFVYRRYEESLEYHRQALILSPQSSSTLSSIGYVHALIGNYSDAVDYFHKVTFIMGKTPRFPNQDYVFSNLKLCIMHLNHLLPSTVSVTLLYTSCIVP